MSFKNGLSCIHVVLDSCILINQIDARTSWKDLRMLLITLITKAMLTGVLMYKVLETSPVD